MNKLFLITGFVLLISFAAPAQVNVMTYNIKYATENDGENSWSKRKDHLTNQLKFYHPDIMGVQEALHGQLEHIKEHVADYQYVGAARDDGKTKGEYSAVFYNTTKFEMLEEGTFWLSETPKVPSKGWDASFPRVCTWVKLKEKEGGKEFFVFNTHFDHEGDEAREKSTQLILDKMAEINKEEKPAILMGDLNLEPDTEPIKKIAAQMNDSKYSAQTVSFGPEGTFNGYDFKAPVERRIDYIFTTKGNIKILKYGVLSDSKDLKYPSDHLPVVVKLRFQ
ncbi:endonuclease/exonuclease/phosphatase family protein [Antarcticibacterium flavum]|uniref:Endonuclease/exonuclease/phosphatase family protein n=1 Tax=Antarcticibacterium flavum TaxID=2058175 RepID=A0A5B7X5H9_9FLAO|nr:MULTISPECIES: endonuclease/exonuclease/phosphatase family protein [Antarcticibacterium]MCM4159700.1 endonuclease/exonuclease/phosphatase [Antarcticibacterium sp. W02-3]QCY70637.1 endonuclease/exonuclease/phosphatase family protein [Antarcticibacterium flavum]